MNKDLKARIQMRFIYRAGHLRDGHILILDESMYRLNGRGSGLTLSFETLIYWVFGSSAACAKKSDK
jgi:hypothetical protein